MGIQQDVIEICGYPFPVSFFQLLASTLMVDSNGNYFFNFMFEFPTECDCTPVIDCDKAAIPPENLLVLGFGQDACGHLAIKFGNCDGTAGVSRPQ